MADATTSATTALAALPLGAAAQPEVFTARFSTLLTAPLPSALRPINIAVANTLAAFGAGSFSIAIYDAGTDANPQNFEALQVIAGGSTLSWTVVTEAGWSASAHAIGSVVIATVLTPRSIQQQLTNHITPATIVDPHSIYIRKAVVTGKGNLIVGTGNGTVTNQPVGPDGTMPVADSLQASGIRWAIISGAIPASTSMRLAATASMTIGPTWSTPPVTAPANLAATVSMTAIPGIANLTNIQSSSAPAVGSSGTISTAGVSVARVSPAGAVTAVILQAWTPGNPPEIWVVNEAIAANTVQFDVAGTSHVADGAGTTIAGLTGRKFIWSEGAALWFRAG